MKRCVFSLFASLGLIAGGAASAAPPAYSVGIELVVDTATPLPNDPKLNFGDFAASSTVLTEGGLLFANLNTGGFQNPSLNGVYVYDDAGVRSIASTGSPPFEGSITGYLLNEAYSDGESVVFRSALFSPSDDEYEIWQEGASGLSNVVPHGFELPNSSGPASGVAQPRVSGENVLFIGADSEGTLGIYRTSRNGGPVLEVVGQQSVPEFSVEDASFDLGDFENEHFVFRTMTSLIGSGTGVYVGDLDGSVAEIADAGDPVPGREGQFFSRFGGETTHPSMDAGRIAFIGQASGPDGARGVYTRAITEDTLQVVVDDTMSLPNDNGDTIGFGSPSISGDNISFLTVGSNGRGSGLYVSVAGTILDIIHVGDELDGKIIESVQTGSFALHENQIAFSVQFEDNSRGLYLATFIPSPGVAPLIGVAALFVGRRRR